MLDFLGRAIHPIFASPVFVGTVSYYLGGFFMMSITSSASEAKAASALGLDCELAPTRHMNHSASLVPGKNPTASEKLDAFYAEHPASSRESSD